MQKNIVFVKSLFCPNQAYFDTTYNSILNNINYILTISLKIKIIFVGWIKEKFRNKIKILIEIMYGKINIDFIPWDKNYGKIKLYYDFNHMIEDHNYIFYADHDILFDITKTKINIIFNNLDILFNNHDFTMLVLNQLEDCRHQTSLLENIGYYNNVKISISNNNIDIGGGCFIVKKIQMACPSYYHVYGFDEKYLISCFSEKKCGLLMDHFVIHPYDTNNNGLIYKKWKINQILNQMETFDCMNKSEYENQMKISHLLWEE